MVYANAGDREGDWLHRPMARTRFTLVEIADWAQVPLGRVVRDVRAGRLTASASGRLPAALPALEVTLSDLAQARQRVYRRILRRLVEAYACDDRDAGTAADGERCRTPRRHG